MSPPPHIPARPTVYKGVQMRSRTEARVAATYDERNFLWDYEPMCFADEKGQYLPDFRVRWGPECTYPIYVEVKGALLGPDEIVELQDRMEVIRRHEDCSLEILFPSYGFVWRAGLAAPGELWHLGGGPAARKRLWRTWQDEGFDLPPPLIEWRLGLTVPLEEVD